MFVRAPTRRTPRRRTATGLRPADIDGGTTGLTVRRHRPDGAAPHAGRRCGATRRAAVRLREQKGTVVCTKVLRPGPVGQ
ncbi:hypothetical protein DN051_32610 [Streptomyces cadmiisoli]|uniref:Uncharacterized protein n=1 Tax=Streptomyces cadmiisoli TaxID=2184053 RepID=A0A2Z4J6G3_9ACTN|nr:hypothetical protein DN051_32610 [Streptomyces cadmiisoli]